MKTIRGCAGVSKNRWTVAETELLRELVAAHGARSWNNIASQIPGRNAKQCRERWSTYCDPEFTRDKWTPQEEQQLMQLHRTYGNRWSAFSKYLNNRSPVAIRNRWMCITRRGDAPEYEVQQHIPVPTGCAESGPRRQVDENLETNWHAVIDDIFGDLPDWVDQELNIFG